MKRTAAEDDEIAYAFASHGVNKQQPQQRRLTYTTATTDTSATLATTATKYIGQQHERHFREKRVVTEAGLQMDVNDLKAQIAHLLLTRSLLTSRALMRRDDSQGSLVKTVRTYYELFRNGYTPLPMNNHETSALTAISPKLKRQRYVASSSPASQASSSANTTRQVAFLQAMLSPAMDADGGRNGAGFNRKLELWRRYTALFALHDFRMKRCDVVTADRATIVRTRGEFSMRVTQATIDELFPHILRSNNKLQRQRLLDKVMGQKLTCPCAIDLYFDAQGRVMRYDEATDFVRAFSAVVKDPRDLVTLFHGASIWEARLVDPRESNGDCTTPSSSPGSSPTSSTATGSGSGAASEGRRDSKRARKRYSISFLLNHEALLGKKSILKSNS
ncbi:hypothetical protein Gpo141_00002404 [Globisporangium polare]